MTSNLRSMIFGVGCLALALGLVSCSSSDLGETLSVEFTTTPGMGISLTTPGTAASGTTAATPDQYTGSGTITAKVIYLGKKTLTYKWSYSLPQNVGATGTVTQETLQLNLTGSSPIGIPLDIGDGLGSATLEVYENAGNQYKKASTPFQVVRGYSG
jgi:hypothetical protein